MPQALPYTDRISQGSTRTRTNRVLAAQFGDGYEQTAPDGINNKIDTWSISYDNLTLAERNAVWAVLDAVGSYDYLTWTPIGEVTSKRFKVTSDGVSEQPVSGDLYNISFTMKQTW